MAPAEVIPSVRTRAISLRWIISPGDDLIWLIGSVASSYLLLILYARGIIPLVPMVAFWAILIDAPHVFGTFSRTYFDRTEWRNRVRLPDFFTAFYRLLIVSSFLSDLRISALTRG